MAKEEQSNSLAKIAPVGAPLLGAVLAVAFIAAVLMTSSVSENRDQLQQTISTVSSRMTDTEVEAPDWGEIPLAEAVPASLQDAPKNGWKPGDAKPVLTLPLLWQVELTPPDADYFEENDLNRDGFWTKEEFSRTGPYTNPDRAKFENWDRNKDGQISREEYDNPPASESENFAKADVNGDGVLTSPNEITEQEAYDWDRQDPVTGEYDGKINLDEYTKRWDPREERDLGAVSNVRVSVDPTSMEIVVSWDEPQVDSIPEDIAYYIERFAPETYEERKSAYRIKVTKYMEALTAWNKRFDAWWNEPAPEGAKSRKELFSRRPDAEVQYVADTSDTKPIEPKEPGAWEPVTDSADALASGTEYRDTSFIPGATYTYAVRMVTQKPVRDQPKVRDLAGLGSSWNGYPDRVQQQGQPVLVRNRIEMRWKSQAGQTGTVTLAKWHRIGEDWYKVRVTQTLEANDSVGGEYSKNTLEDMDGELIDVNGTATSLEILPDDDKVDLSTGFSYITNASRGFLLNSRELGDFELPSATKQEPAEKDDAAGKDNPIEVRALTVKNGGKEGMFEVTRWHKVGDEWLRVVWRGMVKKDGDVGGEVNLASKGKNVTVWDDSGEEVTKKLEGTVDLAAGTYDDLDGRTVVVGGERFDLFGTLYK